MYNHGKGKRCHVCTGCGICPGAFQNSQKGSGVHVLAQEIPMTRLAAESDGQGFVVAADVGTTTIAMLLYNASGIVCDRYLAVNPQTEYGRDVLSRIEACRDVSVARRMKEMVEQTLRDGICRFQKWIQLHTGAETAEQSMTDKAKSIESIVVAANTTMKYLLLGYDPAELGQAPFCAGHLSWEESRMDQIPMILLPGLSAFVGGDITAGIVATGMHLKRELTLLVDLGTNGELVLGNKDGFVAGATAAGPAFEGGAGRGIWGADMVHLTAELLRKGLVDETGLLKEPYFKTGVKIGNCLMKQEALRALQLAKGAIAAGIELLLKQYGVSAADVDRVILAGGMGYFLRPEDAVCIGMLPKDLQDKTWAGGNTALQGAAVTGFCKNRADYEQIKHLTHVVNFAEQTDFNQIYMKFMDFLPFASYNSENESLG